MPTLLIVHHTPSPALQEMFEAFGLYVLGAGRAAGGGDRRLGAACYAPLEMGFDRLTLAAVAGLAGRDALHAIATAFRAFATAHPGRYAATVRAPIPGDTEYIAASDGAIGLLAAVLTGYRIEATT